VRRMMLLNPDPASKWGRHILAQLERAFRECPECAGVMFDQTCYHSYDFSRDDGMTMLNNRPCFDTHGAYLAMKDKVVKILRKYGKTTFTNGPYNVEIQRGLDGIMAEGGLVEMVAMFSYMTLAKPMMTLPHNRPIGDTELILKHCLKYGAFAGTREHLMSKPRVNISKEELRIYRRYMPLIEQLRGRRWVLHAHALSLPGGYDGNIFRNPRGRYVVTMYPVESLSADRRNAVGPRRVTLRLPDVKGLRRVTWLSTETRSERKLSLKPCGKGYYALDVREYADASVFVI